HPREQGAGCGHPVPRSHGHGVDRGARWPPSAKGIPMTKTIAALLLASAVACPAFAATKEEKRQDVRDVTASTLERLYKAQPHAKDAVERSAGYAVFSNFGMKILFAG